MDESDDHPPYINRHNHDPRLLIYDPAIYEMTPEASVYGNPYYRANHPFFPDCPTHRGRDCVLFNKWGLSRYGPAFVDAKSGSIIVSERDRHRLQIFDNVRRPGNGPYRLCQLGVAAGLLRPRACNAICRLLLFPSTHCLSPLDPQSADPCLGDRGDGPNQFDNPGGVTTTNEHYAKVAVADTGNRRVCLFRVSSDHRGYGVLDFNYYFGQQIFQAPTGLEWDSKRNFLVVTDQTTRKVSQHDLRTGQCVGEFRPPSSMPLTSPTDVAIDGNGLCYVTDADSNSVHLYERNGDFICRFGGPGEFNKPAGLCFDRASNILIADESNNRVVMYRAYDGARVTCGFERVLTTNVYCPKGVSVNTHENLVVCDSTPHSFLKIFKYK